MSATEGGRRVSTPALPEWLNPREDGVAVKRYQVAQLRNPITAGEARRALLSISSALNAAGENQRSKWSPIHAELLHHTDLAVRRKGYNSELRRGLVGPLVRLLVFCATRIAFMRAGLAITATAIRSPNPESAANSVQTPIQRGRLQGAITKIRKARNALNFWTPHRNRYRALLRQGRTATEARNAIKENVLRTIEGRSRYPDGISEKTLRKYLTNGKGRGRPPGS